MVINRLEAICDAVAHCNQYWEPESESYQWRNPGLLVQHNSCGDRDRNAKEGYTYRKFSCHQGGYRALQEFVKQQYNGNAERTLEWLLIAIGVNDRMHLGKAIDFIARSTDSVVTLDTQLKWFLEQ